MTRDLVPYNPPPGNGATSSTSNETNGHDSRKLGTSAKTTTGSINDPDLDHWDLPPVDARHAYLGSYHSAQRDYREAQNAQHHGDSKRARGRRQDAEENLQTIWDWGDLRTWLVIAAMFFFGITLACTAYVLPHGRDAAPPGIFVH